MKSRLKIIPFEDRKGLACCKCGETRSVKYKIHGENFCNKCALVEEVNVVHLLMKSKQTWGR